ncbi:hypothetical protein [Alteromonas facilis]|uniref:hypothetical protein n=1 Tax=Alteromonas facilis TaxID=2048004 RepID=UPI000C283EF1|nr:hypothetical protein [Alteromonas facilis]
MLRILFVTLLLACVSTSSVAYNSAFDALADNGNGAKAFVIVDGSDLEPEVLDSDPDTHPITLFALEGFPQSYSVIPLIENAWVLPIAKTNNIRAPPQFS